MNATSNKFVFQSANKLSLAEGKTQTWEQILRLGSFTDPRYGRFDITPELFQSFIKNFQDNVFGQKIFVDVAHEPEEGAAGEITALRQEGDWLLAQIAWTPMGIDAVRNKGFVYLSAEYSDNFQDNETGNYHGALIMGCGLTLRPVIKRQKAISLSLSEDQRLLVDPILVEQAKMKLSEIKQRLQQDLAALTLSEAVIGQLVTAFETAGKDQSDEVLESLVTQFTATGKTLAETKPEPGQTIQLSVQTGGLSKAEVIKLWQEQETARLAEAKRLADTTAGLCKLFVDTVDAEKGLPNDIRKMLSEEGVKVINPAMTEDGVKALAATQLKLGQQIAASRQLAGLGYRPQGSVHISLDESNTVKSLQEVVDRRLGLLDMAASERYRQTGGSLPEVNKKFAEKVLARFDQENGARLHQEHKLLAAGSGIVADVVIGPAWERTVIREFLFQLIGLSFVNADSLPFSTSYSIPYSYRDTTAAGVSATTVYQGAAIPYSGVIQVAENVYPMPQKLAFKVSDELRYLTAQNQFSGWDVLAENTQNAQRIIAEDTDARLFNEILWASDSYGATTVTTETLTSQVNGTNGVFQLANFPVCRPKRINDLAGTQIGSTTFPVVVTYNSVVRAEWYSGITAGTYYRLDYNLGEISIVNETGTIVIPTNATPLTVAYWKVNNVVKFDTDLGSLTTPAKWDTFLYQYSQRKNVIQDQRFHMCDHGLMSGTVMSLIEQATQFGANSMRTGTDLVANGNLGRIKDVPNYRTAAPGLWMGDQRIILGERNTVRFRLCKPWQMTELENVTDNNGKFLGQKQAYGDQFIVLMTPTPLRNAYTSIVLWSTAARVPRVS